MAPKTKLNEIHVTPFLLGWQIKVNGRRVGRFVTQSEAEATATFLAKLMQPTTLKLHDRRGRIKPNGERTFPRSADPRKTPS